MLYEVTDAGLVVGLVDRSDVDEQPHLEVRARIVVVAQVVGEAVVEGSDGHGRVDGQRSVVDGGLVGGLHRRGRLHQSSRSGQEGGRLCPGHLLLRAVAGRAGGAPCCDPRSRYPVDVGRVGLVGGGVGEPRGLGRGQVERPCQQSGHLGPIDGVIPAEPQRLGAAAGVDPQQGQALGVPGPPHVGAHIVVARHGRGRVAALGHPHQPDSHLPAEQRFVGAEAVAVRAPGALEHIDVVQARQSVDRGLVNAGAGDRCSRLRLHGRRCGCRRGGGCEQRGRNGKGGQQGGTTTEWDHG